MTSDTAHVVRQKLVKYNARLESARSARGYTQKYLAELTGINLNILGEYERLSRVPTSEHMDEISSALDQPVGYLFPSALIKAVKSRITGPKTRYVTYERLLAYSEVRELPALENLEEEILGMEAKSAILEVLGTLKPREERILRMRYGIDDGNDSTLEQIGEVFGVGAERIRQIESKALQKLRRPSNAGKLKHFLKH